MGALFRQLVNSVSGLRHGLFVVTFAVLLLFVAPADSAMAPRSSDFQIAESSENRYLPAVAADSSGSFVVVWDSTGPGQFPVGRHVHGRRFDADGLPVGTEFQIDTATDGFHGDVKVSHGPDGTFLVAWRVSNIGETPRIEARQLSSDGNPIGDTFQVNSPRTVEGEYYVSPPAVSEAGDGFVVVWSSGFFRIGEYSIDLVTDVYGRRVTAGAPSGLDFRVSSLADPETVTQNEADVAALPDGFVVVWAEGEIVGLDSDFQVRSRRFDAEGNALGTELVVGEEGAAGPEVAADDAGHYFVAWPTWRYVDYPIPSHVRARTFATDGTPLAAEFEVSTPGDDDSAYEKTVTGLQGLDAATDGDAFVVVWSSGSFYFEYGGSSDGQGVGLFTRDFALSGAPLGIEKQVNDYGFDDQYRPALAFGVDGRALAVWESHRNPYGRVFDRFARTCGDSDESGEISSTDALAALQGAVGIRACELCTCDADGSTLVTATDALAILRVAVGESFSLDCVACPESSGD